ncbi:hypothetical protein [Aminobacter sp. HY435]|uniref:hypothetical protein n=1 Tax=Aminobacter sp. HY435 TaxID=2970917 RepID=UPI0022B95D9A|nr:hypothetical protein [Aminobacter sp. HY435]
MGTLARDIHPVAACHRFMVGRDTDGHWVVSDELGMVGGIFADKEAAVRFALTESGHVPGAVFCAPTGVTLNLDPLLERPARPAALSHH